MASICLGLNELKERKQTLYSTDLWFNNDRDQLTN